MKYVLILIAILFSNQAVALDCSKQQTCAELNYSKEDNPKCDKNGYILCPYDQSYKKCVRYNCETLGFTQSDKSEWCADIAHCITDSAYTACQSPCLATTYEELSTLAESGKCKIITMKNDITIPFNQGITVAANTIIDGGGHTLFSSANQPSLIMLSMQSNNILKNLKFSHHHTQNQENYALFKATDKIYLENVEIDITSKANTGNRATLFQDSYEIKGNFKVNINSPQIAWAFSRASLDFKNANFDINLKTQNADVFYTKGSSFENTSGKINYTGGALTQANVPMNFKNSKIIFERSSFYSGRNSLTYSDWTLHEGSEVTLNNWGTDITSTLPIKLQGTEEKPAKIIFGNKITSSLTIQITTQNTTDMVVLDGMTYRSTKPAMTNLSDITTSGNWEKIN